MSTAAIFNPEQQAAIEAAVTVLHATARSSAEARLEVRALKSVLVRKGLLTEVDWMEAKAEMKALVAVEAVFDPVFRRIETTFDELLRRIRGEREP